MKIAADVLDGEQDQVEYQEEVGEECKGWR